MNIDNAYCTGGVSPPMTDKQAAWWAAVSESVKRVSDKLLSIGHATPCQFYFDRENVTLNEHDLLSVASEAETAVMVYHAASDFLSVSPDRGKHPGRARDGAQTHGRNRR